jgi:hypothetical protein
LQNPNGFENEYIGLNNFLPFKYLGDDINYKDYSNRFINHCGYLENGISTNLNHKNLMIGNILDNAINNFLIRKLFIKK